METYTSIEVIIDKIIRDTGNRVTFSNDWYDWIMEAVQDLAVTQNLISKQAILVLQNFSAPLPCYCNTVMAVYYNNQALPYIRRTGIATQSPYLYYYIEGGRIFCPQDLTLYITYLSYQLDERGFPMLPDNHLYQETVYLYVLMKMITTGFQHPVFDYNAVRQLYNESKRKAKAYFTLPSLAQHHTNQNLSNRLVQSPYPNYYPEDLNVSPYK